MVYARFDQHIYIYDTYIDPPPTINHMCIYIYIMVKSSLSHQVITTNKLYKPFPNRWFIIVLPTYIDVVLSGQHWFESLYYQHGLLGIHIYIYIHIIYIYKDYDTYNRWYVYHSQMGSLWHCFTNITIVKSLIHIINPPPTINHISW